MLLELVVYLAPAYLGLGYFIYYLVHHKERSLQNKLITFFFIFYVISVIYLTLFPFPLDKQGLELIQQFGYSLSNINWIPFKSSMSLKQAVLNFIMLFPLGIFAPIIFKKSKESTILLNMILTPLLIEVIQGTVSWLLQGTWKQADINDFLLNASGAIVGYLFYKGVSKVFPSLDRYLKS